MKAIDVIRSLRSERGPSIVLLVLDGLGDIPTPDTGFKTPLEAASTPNLDAICPKSALGRIHPVGPGITPGSGPAHLALFGYDPLEVHVGRGVIEALGLDLDVPDGALAARANFATVENGVITDRRAGRISDAKCASLCERLRDLPAVDGVTVEVAPGKSHRFVVLFHGPGLEGPLTDSDPGKEGHAPRSVTPQTDSKAGRRSADVVNAFVKRALERLRGEHPANAILLRGIDRRPELEPFPDRFGLRAAAIAPYPMYRGLGQLVGMTKIPTPDGPEAEVATWASVSETYDFGFIHIKATDMHGEDGNFEAKAKAIESVDAALPALLDTRPGVLAITGDHSTPVSYRGHGWHAVPLLVHAPRAGCDGLDRFSERTAVLGSLGTFPSRDLMPILLASAGRLQKFGA